jgi:hypothetical protein
LATAAPASAGARRLRGKRVVQQGLAARHARIRAFDRPSTSMEAEQLNQIAHTLADLKSRTAEMRRFL